MKNLLQETLNDLKENRKTPADVRGVGRASINAKCSWDDFAKQANFEYDNGYGSAEIPGDLIVAGDDWWLERAEYDGSEWWAFKTPPVEPKVPKCVFNRELGLRCTDSMLIFNMFPNGSYEVLKAEEWSKPGLPAHDHWQLGKYVSGDTEPEVYDFYVRTSVHTGIQPLASIIEEQRRFMFDFNEDGVGRRMGFNGAIKKVEAITGNIAKISVEVLSEIMIQNFTRW